MQILSVEIQTKVLNDLDEKVRIVNGQDGLFVTIPP